MINKDKDMDSYKIRNSGCLQENKLGHFEAKLEEHSKDIEDLKSCVEHKRRRLDNLEIVDATTLLNFQNLEKRVVAKECKDDQRHSEMMKTFTDAIETISGKFSKMESQLFQIKWIAVGIGSTLGFFLLIMEKFPAIFLNIQKLF